MAGRWPWPRAVHSTVIDYLAQAGAKVIAYDVLFTERDTRTGFAYGGDTWSGAESDGALVDSTKQAGTVVLLADANFAGMTGGAALPDEGPLPDAGYRLDARVEARPSILQPFAGLAQAARGLGHNLFVLDEDGPIRWVVPFVRAGGRDMPSLGVAAALAAEGVPPGEVTLDGRWLRLGRARMPLVERRVPGFVGQPAGTSLRALIDYRGPAVLPDGKSRPYASYSFYHVVYSAEQALAGQKPDLDPALFRGKIVFIGITASGLADTFQTPFGATGTMPGIQIHASVADDILSNRFVRPAGGGALVASVAGVGLAVGLAGVYLAVPWAVAAAAAAGAGYLLLAVQLFRQGLWLNVTQPLLALGLALFGGVAFQYFVEGREKRRIKAIFGRYVSPAVYGRLLHDPALAQLGGSRREMTVLFSDIRGFTTATEKAQPEALVAQLNEHFTRMVRVIFEHRGTVDKFVGDMVMALFGAPLDDPDHADHAVSAALGMVAALGELNRTWAAEGRPPLAIGVGINTGEMIAGNIGSQQIMSYTVIGDAVNLGSRLESLNKEYGTRIIISDATRSRLAGRYELRPLGEVVVKGKTRAVGIFEVVCPEPDAAGHA